MKGQFAVAIDGPVAAGKTTIGRLLAERICALFFDTGVVYRAVALDVLERSIDPEDDTGVTAVAQNLHLELVDRSGETRVALAGRDVTNDLRTPEIDRALPPIAANPTVREALLPVQRRIAGTGRVVVVGRDIGTVILPEADLKIYLDADSLVRAQRRHDELLSRGVDITLDQVLCDLEARDQRDLTRSRAPLQVAVDAVTIDATNFTVDEVVDEILSCVRALRLDSDREAVD